MSDAANVCIESIKFFAEVEEGNSSGKSSISISPYWSNTISSKTSGRVHDVVKNDSRSDQRTGSLFSFDRLHKRPKTLGTSQQIVSDRGISDGLAQFKIDWCEANGLSMIAALNLVGFAKSNGEARRLVRGGGARLNDHTISNEEASLRRSDFINGKAKISAGKKRHALIVLR